MTILDPRNPTASGTAIPAGNVPLTVAMHQFGFVPDVSALMPGDLVLFSPLKPAKGALFTWKGQQNHAPHAAGWTHAAVFVEGYTVVEAMPRVGVRTSSLLECMTTHLMMFRRPAMVANEPDPMRAQVLGLRIAVAAALRLSRVKYRIVLYAIRVGMNMRYWFGREPAGTICSELYAKCVYLGTGQTIVPQVYDAEGRPVTPAVLASASTLVTLDVGWRALSS